tara:strand:+ start:423 stop:758 length:336 start_codon:yes stop_codon:yes gene_type:complete
VIEKELFPAVEIVTASEPEVAVEDVQLAEQEEAFVEDQVKVEVLLNKTEVGSAERFTIGVGVTGEEEPPPPPPPQEIRSKVHSIIGNALFIYLMYEINTFINEIPSTLKFK